LAINSEEAIEGSYYAATADRYDKMHLAENDEHYIALGYISAFLDQMDVRTVLDLGCGTGRALAYLTRANPEIKTFGIEPVRELLNIAVKKRTRTTHLVNGNGVRLPFRSGSIDAVLGCGILHHVREPQRLVEEMTRVARKAVFLSDSNIFGQGKLGIRLLKLSLYKAGLRRFVKFAQTGGKGYTISQGDGLSYSYSVYFQYNFLREWASRMIAIPLRESVRTPLSWSPIYSADTVLLCGIR
jgi:ubiquinone/menaquinone biosynthesis C-methylase UbiE